MSYFNGYSKTDIDNKLNDLKNKINQVKVQVTVNQTLDYLCFNEIEKQIPIVPIKRNKNSDTVVYSPIRFRMKRIEVRNTDDAIKWIITETNAINWRVKQEELNEADRQFKMKQKEMSINKQLQAAEDYNKKHPKIEYPYDVNWKSKAEQAQILFLQNLKLEAIEKGFTVGDGTQVNASSQKRFKKC